MAGTHHGGKRTALHGSIGRMFGERTDALAPRKGLGCSDCSIVVMAEPTRGIAIDPSSGQSIGNAARTKTAPRQSIRAHGRERIIVNIAQRGEFGDERANGRLLSLIPATLADLARKIGREFCTCRRVSTDVTQCERTQSGEIERASTARRLHAPRLCHSRTRLGMWEVCARHSVAPIISKGQE